MKQLLAFALALILAAVAQHSLRGGETPSRVAILFLPAALLFLWAADKPAPWPPLPLRRCWPRWSLALTGSGLLLGVIALALFWRPAGSRPQFTGLPLWLWFISIPLFVVGTWFQERSPHEEKKRDISRWEIGLLFLILLAAFFLRVWQIDRIPNGCQSDECNNGLDALQWLSGAPYTPYAHTNEGQATFFTYLLALSLKLLGANVPNMRLVSAISGTVTVLAFYLLARDLFGPKAGLAASGLLAACRWHITFSRIVYELILMPLFEVLLVYLLLRALREGRRGYWALAGVALGGGLHTYTAFRVIPFLVAGFLIYWFLYTLVMERAGKSLPPQARQPSRLWQDLEGVACLVGAAALTVLPLGVYAVQHWDIILSRTRHISVFVDVSEAGSYAPIWSNLRKTLLMFNWRGDAGGLNGLPNAPLLDFVAGVLFVLGLAYALRHILRPLPFLYVAWFIVAGSVAVLSVAHEAPTARRSFGLVPLLYLLAGLAIDQVWRAVRRTRWRETRAEAVLAGAMALLVIGVGISNAYTYFAVQAINPSVLFAFSPHESAIGQYLAQLEGDPYILMTPNFVNHSAVRFIGQRKVTPLNFGQQIPLRQDVGRDLLYLLDPVDERLEPLFRQVYPAGKWQVQRDRYGRPLFISFEVPQERLAEAQAITAQYFSGRETKGTPALVRQEKSLEFDWTVAPPLASPFSASWEGALQVPSFGEYRFELAVMGGRARVLLDGQLLVEGSDGLAQTQRALAGGFYSLTCEFISGDTPQRLRLAWAGPGFAMQTVGSGALYMMPDAAHGLVGYYYANANWKDPPALVQRDLFIMPHNPLPVPYSIRWRGKIAAPRAGQYRFSTCSDDGSFIHVDGRLVVDNGGEHGAQCRDGDIVLSEGFHDIEVRYFQSGGSREMQLWWTPPGGAKEVIPSQYLFPLDKVPEGLELPMLATAPQPVPTPVTVTAGPAGEPSALEVRLLWRTGSCGSGKAEFQLPRGVAVDAAGNTYVADAANHRVVKLSPEGKPLLTWGKEGKGDGLFSEPFDLVVDSQGNIVVLDTEAGLLQRFTSQGKFLATFGKELSLYHPRGLGIDTEDNLYVVDTGGARVLKLSSKGARLAQFGGPGTVIGSDQPTDVAVSPNGEIYLVAPGIGVLWQVDANGNPLKRWQVGKANTVDSPHIAIDLQGRVYVTDPEGGRVLAFAADGQPLGYFGPMADRPGELRKPVGIAAGAKGAVYVSDSQGCRITAFGVP